MSFNRYCLALDLKNDEELIKEYEAHHKAVWPAIIESIKNAGVIKMEIYRVENRLFLIMETDNDFTFDNKKRMDESNPAVQEWETLMRKYQQPLLTAREGEKWLLMQKIFTL